VVLVCGMWYWYVVLICGIVMWYLVLVCGMWYWYVILVCGIGMWYVLQLAKNFIAEPSEVALTPLFIDAVSYGKVAKCPREIMEQNETVYTEYRTEQ